MFLEYPENKGSFLMIIEPKILNNVCLTSHPVGCAMDVRRQIDYVKAQGVITGGPKNVLVVGSSTGYGLASRITAAFGSGAKTIGVAYEKEGSEKRPGTAGWYNTAAFDKESKAAGLYSYSINGDAFSFEIKNQAIAAIKENMGKVDLVIYSLASGVRTDPTDGVTYRSALKTRSTDFTAKSIDPFRMEVKQSTIAPATPEEEFSTVKVMGGEDWELWIDALDKAGVLAQGCTTVAYSYIGPECTKSIYRDGTIGKAKEHLEATALKLNKELSTKVGGSAYVSVNKALVTRASSVIPVVSFYISILYKVMKEMGIHEGCIEQIYRLYKDRLYTGKSVPVDGAGLIRIDDWEMRPDVQKKVMDIWDLVTTENLAQYTDVKGFQEDFLQLHGFSIAGVDYTVDVEA